MSRPVCRVCFGSGRDDDSYNAALEKPCYECDGAGVTDDVEYEEDYPSAYDEDDEFCLYPGECCMAYTHHTSDECYTAADVEADMEASAGL